jgi:cell division protein FtsZ
MGLLQRLASVGLGRRDNPGETESVEGRRPAQLEPPRPSNRPGAGRQSDSRSAADSASEYGNKRHGHQGLDPLGRQAPVNNSPDEDQLEIPAFLRRQAT